MRVIHIVGACLVLNTLAGAGAWLSAEQDHREQKQQGSVPTVQPASVTGRTPNDDDLVTAGRTVRVTTEVRGDVAAAGSEVTIDAPVDGYVMSAGRVVTLVGQIGNDLWAAGETVNVDSPIANNVMVAGRTVHLRPNT